MRIFVCLCVVLFLAYPVFAADFSVKNSGGYRIGDPVSIQKFYTERDGDLLWVDGDEFSRDAKDIIQKMEGAWAHGLNPANYHFTTLKEFSKNGIPENKAMDTEILFADAVIRFGQDLSGMRVNPKNIGEDTSSWSRGIDGYSLLSILSRQSDPVDFLNQLLPNDKEYKLLSDELKKLVEDLAKTPDTNAHLIKYTGTINRNARHASIPAIRDRLGDNQKSDVYDDELQKKVEDFQSRHGLVSDGVIGRRTFDAINQTRTQKLIKLIANLERRRWVRRPMLSRRIEVNIPRMELKAIDNDDVQFEIPVIVGRENRPTMSFVDNIIGVRFNPRWYVPDTIKNEDFLPKLRKNPHALNDHGINFRVKTSDGFKVVDPSSIDWKAMTADGLKNVQMYQGSGDDNALGLVRVLMPNKYDIYLHDTNAPELFAKDDRALSSGCVRLSEPKRIANFVLGKNSGWSEGKMNGYIDSHKLIEVLAQQPVPVYLFYYTAWLEKGGDVIIANDVYGQDTKLVAALQVAGKIPFDLPRIQ